MKPKIAEINVNDVTPSKSSPYDSNESGSVTKPAHGTGVLVTILFISGDTVGCGILALPFALSESGWFGLPLMIMAIVDATIAGILIGECWVILEERWPEFKQHCRVPYMAIGKMAYGDWMENIVTACLQLSLIGGAIVEFIICAQLISNLCAYLFGTDIPFSVWLLIVGIVLIPLSWFGSPADMWWAGALALATSVGAMGLIMIATTQEYLRIEKQPEYPSPTFASTSLAFGTFLFAVGATSIFPTLQNDMKDKSKFTRAVLAGNSIVLVIYIAVTVLGFVTYGGLIKPNITSSISDGAQKYIAMFLIALHLIFAFNICINGAFQEIEQKLNIPQEFGWKRVTVRTLTMIFVIFMGESVPKFGKVLDLVGGSAVTMLTFVCPCLFYMKLVSMENPSWPQRKLSNFESVYYYKIIMIGIIGGISCTYWALMAILSPGAFSTPCYIDIHCSSE